MAAGKPCILAAGVLLVACCVENPSEANRPRAGISGRSPTSARFDRFWREFQGSVRKNEIQQLASLVQFPLRADLSGIEGFHGIDNPGDFERHFEILFPAEAVQGMLASKTVPSVVVQAGRRSWHFAYHHDDEVSEQEWSVIYVFEEIPDGSIRLTEVQFAG